MNHSIFRIRYKTTARSEPIELGTATLIDNNVRFQPNDSSDWLIKQSHAWLTNFHPAARKQIKSLGHVGKFSISWNEETGIEVERK